VSIHDSKRKEIGLNFGLVVSLSLGGTNVKVLEAPGGTYIGKSAKSADLGDVHSFFYSRSHARALWAKQVARIFRKAEAPGGAPTEKSGTLMRSDSILGRSDLAKSEAQEGHSIIFNIILVEITRGGKRRHPSIIDRLVAEHIGIFGSYGPRNQLSPKKSGDVGGHKRTLYVYFSFAHPPSPP
jgi:hypothetical protein